MLTYRDEDLWYINQQDLNVDNLSQGQILSLLSPNIENDRTYLSISISGTDVLRLSFKLKYSINGKVDVIEYERYKGCYN